MERYYQPEIECASREQIRAWQNERLIPTVKRVYENVPYYRRLMEEKNVTPADIRTIDDPVSYTHLDVYKRQSMFRALT